ncbi:hypothetical protein ACH79_14255 [Bradyrhizobium sp. CCBAU 051011]|uniref:primase-helicase family protein n=1 Tax=Bradyrhizobium sp. CCBAU 051011 TaxID=858422 RepID=UPI0013741CBA|nr:primase-helicase family protein [Bradyrhizobium sp. CCBAU 051011]QHO73635.1 hypothetical protein ACH79_14255 [Bradyrhizobium sp. CCBAU 051011]
MKTNFDDWIPPGAAAEFDAMEDDSDDRVAAEGYPEEAISKLEDLNTKYCAVVANGKYRIMSRQDSDAGKRWTAYSRHDFVSSYENFRIERDMTGLSRNASNTIPLGEAWQTWPRRKTAYGTTFDTKGDPGGVVNGRLNLWTGFAIEPSGKGSCELFKAMIRDDLCAGDTAVYNYVLKWTAWKLQNPDKLPGVALVFLGSIGVGKSTFADTLVGLFGSHGMSVDSIDALTGDFTGHLESLCLVSVEEAMWGGDVKRLGPMKKLITGAEREYHYKGLDRFRGVNRVALIFLSNEEWVVPAGLEERRYCVSRVSEEHYAPADAPADSENRIYWNDLHSELDKGGRAKFLHEMLSMDLGNWKPYGGDVPKTQAMAEQKFQGLKGFDKWYHDCLRDGELPGGDEAIIQPKGQTLTAANWADGGFFLKPTVVAKAYRECLHYINPRANVTNEMVLKSLKGYGWNGGADLKYRGQRAWEAPNLGDARKAFAEKLGYKGLFAS